MKPVHFLFEKWPNTPHWEYDGYQLGHDAHGTWFGISQGTQMSRPGMTTFAAADHVMLAPYDDWWFAAFYGPDPQRPFDIYVDITTPSYWANELDQSLRLATMTAVDLDLDVIRGLTGRVWIDDEDEFAVHRRTLGYPQDVVENALEACNNVLAEVTARTAPFDDETALGWLARFRGQRS